MEIQAAIASLSAIKSIAGGLIATRDELKVMEAKLALMHQVSDIQQVLQALQDDLVGVKQAKRELEQENRELKQRLARLEENELFEVTPGVFVLAAKPLSGEPHRPPYFCQACESNGKKSVLAFTPPVFDFDPGALSCAANPSHNRQLANSITAQSLGFRS